MSELGDDFRDARKAQQKRRAERLPQRVDEIMTLPNVEKLTDYHFRMDGWLDLFPIHKKFHNLTKNKRGEYFIYKGVVYNRSNKLVISKF